MCCGSEAGSYLRLIDSCITELKDQGPSRICAESKEVEEEKDSHHRLLYTAARLDVRTRGEFPQNEL